ncbi:MAG: hypothetical protein F4219_05760 [Gammaproteobacteria bacterium]|nr:hypothetical protein [Gammaproteobacteria bacterium]
MEPKTDPATGLERQTSFRDVNRPYHAGPMLPDLPKPVKPAKDPSASLLEHLLKYYDFQKSDPNRWEENEIVGVVSGATATAIAALLIFMPITGVERQTSFSAGLTLLGAGIGYALRSVQKK